MSEEQDGFMLNAFGVDLGQLAQNVKEEGAALLSQAGGQATSDFRIPEAPPPEPDPSPQLRIPEAPPPEPDPSPQLRIPEALPPEPSPSAQLPEQPSNDGGGGATGNSDGAPSSLNGNPPEQPSDDGSGGGLTGNSGGAPFSQSGTTPPPESSPSPTPVPPDDGLLEKFGTVVGGLVDGAFEIVKEIPDLIPHGTLPGPVIIAPIEKLLREARGEPDPEDGA
jgi:hypothetical protein